MIYRWKPRFELKSFTWYHETIINTVLLIIVSERASFIHVEAWIYYVGSASHSARVTRRRGQCSIMSLCHIAVHIPIVWLEWNHRLFRNETRFDARSTRLLSWIVRCQTPKAMERWEKGGQQPIRNVRREYIHWLRQRPLHSNASSLSRFDEFNSEWFFEHRESRRERTSWNSKKRK